MNISKDYFYLKGKEAEKYITDLARETFLADWCYSNPQLTNGKERCDLLVISDNTVIIWQVKNLKLDKNGKYKKSEVSKNIRQLSGARRKLLESKTPIELENLWGIKEKINITSIMEVHLISALLGEGEDFSFMRETYKNHFIHVFDRSFIKIMFSELDTISDFIEYLKARADLLKSDKQIIITGGEENLLATYLINNRSFDIFNNHNLITIGEGIWGKLQDREDYKAKKEKDKISYGWDDIINQAHESKSPEYKKVARELARPNRFERRQLGGSFFEAYKEAADCNGNVRYRRTVVVDNVTYCFLFTDNDRKQRKEELKTRCLIARGTYTENTMVLGIATNTPNSPTESYDFILWRLPELNEDYLKTIEELKQKTGILKNPATTSKHFDEYPKFID